jgi:hypothetical protein
LGIWRHDVRFRKPLPLRHAGTSQSDKLNPSGFVILFDRTIEALHLDDVPSGVKALNQKIGFALRPG